MTIVLAKLGTARNPLVSVSGLGLVRRDCISRAARLVVMRLATIAMCSTWKYVFGAWHFQSVGSRAFYIVAARHQYSVSSS